MTWPPKHHRSKIWGHWWSPALRDLNKLHRILGPYHGRNHWPSYPQIPTWEAPSPQATEKILSLNKSSSLWASTFLSKPGSIFHPRFFHLGSTSMSDSLQITTPSLGTSLKQTLLSAQQPKMNSIQLYPLLNLLQEHIKALKGSCPYIYIPDVKQFMGHSRLQNFCFIHRISTFWVNTAPHSIL